MIVVAFACLLTSVANGTAVSVSVRDTMDNNAPQQFVDNINANCQQFTGSLVQVMSIMTKLESTYTVKEYMYTGPGNVQFLMVSTSGVPLSVIMKSVTGNETVLVYSPKEKQWYGYTPTEKVEVNALNYAVGQMRDAAIEQQNKEAQ